MRAVSIINKCAYYRMDKLLLPLIKHIGCRKLINCIFFIANPKACVIPAKSVKASSSAVRLRKFLEDAGPVFIKFGQILSTRRDLLPQDFADELALLQDQVPPFSSALARSIVAAELGNSLSELFADFEEQALASASVAQVHAARLKTGQEVIVKIIRPDITRTIQLDIALMYLCARFLLLVWPDSRKLHLHEIIEDYSKTINNELDLRREAANASQLQHNFSKSDLLHVPEIHWQYTTEKVMTMERIYGIRVTDIAALKAKGINLKKLAERGTEIFYTQVFRDAFFHADMHPGNIFVDPDNPQEPRYLGVDFGIMGSLSEEDQYYLAHNFLAFFRRDYKRVAALHIESGWVAGDTNLLEMEAAIRTVCEPIFARPLRDISFGKLLIQLFKVARQFNMEVQPQLVLLQKTLLNIEGLGRQIYPDLDLWQTGQPFFEKWIKQRTAPWFLARKFVRQAPEWLDRLPDLPSKLFTMLDHLDVIVSAISEKENK